MARVDRLMAYFILVSVLVFLYFLSLENKTSKFVSEKISFLILLIFIGFRYETGGPDWISYESFFDSIEPLNQVLIGRGDFFWDHGFEIGFKLFASFVRMFTDDYIFMNLFAEFIVLISIYHFYRKYTSQLLLAVMVYFASVALLGDMTVVRQMLAVSMFIWALDYLDKSKVKTTIFVLLAFSFHYASIVCLMFLVIYHAKDKLRGLYCVAFVFIIVSIPLGGITSTILDFLSGFSNLGFAIKFKLTQYTKEFSEAEVSIGIGTLERLLFCSLIIVFYKKIKEKFGSLMYVPLSLYLCNLLLSAFFSDMLTFYLRFRYFFIFSTPIVFVLLCGIIKQKWIVPVVFIIYTTLWTYLVISSNTNQYLPYQNYIQIIYGSDPVDRRALLNERF